MARDERLQRAPGDRSRGAEGHAGGEQERPRGAEGRPGRLKRAPGDLSPHNTYFTIAVVYYMRLECAYLW